jgi:hypothetical protein
MRQNFGRGWIADFKRLAGMCGDPPATDVIL